MNELQQILGHLKTLQGRGWPIAFSPELEHPELDLGPLEQGRVWLNADNLREEGWTLVGKWLRNDGYWPCVEVLRGFIEREIQKRKLWEEYKYTLAFEMMSKDSSLTPLESLLSRRPTLLEVLKAAVEVTKEQAEAEV